MKKYFKWPLILLLVFSLSGCAYIGSVFQTFKGELIGNSYQIWEYDNFGERILTLSGDKIYLEGGYDTNGNESSYVDVIVDGHRWEHVGNTLVFVQNGVDMITDFQIPTELEGTDDSTGLIPVDRVINNYQNYFGKDMVVVVFSQTGAPICMFQGNRCYTEVPADLPKTTKVYIDGKLVYLHRANIDIIPTEIFENSKE